MTNIKKTFYVVRDMWDGKLRGVGKLLHSPKEKKIRERIDINPVQMCCLGHMCLQESPEEIQSIYRVDWPCDSKVDLRKYISINVMGQAAAINDSRKIVTNKEKELTKLFAQEGVELKFVDTIHNLPNNVRKMYTRVKIFITGKYR